MKEYDFIAIGGGSGGYNAARVARSLTDSVAIIDCGPELGGLCILHGCMPSKTLIYSAEVLHLAKQAKTFGLSIPDAKVDIKALHQRKLDIIKEFADYRVEGLTSGKYDLYRNTARFVDRNVIELDDGTRLRGKKILVATGSRVAHPPIPGIELDGVWTSDEVLEIDEMYKSIIVLGGGVVACELAQFLQRIGIQVIQIQRSPHIIKEQATDVSEVIEKAFRDDGIQLYTDTNLKCIQKADNGVFEVIFEHQGKQITVSSERVVNALGRDPNTDDIGLEKAGIELRHNRQIITDPYQRTTNPDVYAAGDCASPYEIVHTAVLQGEFAAYHAHGVHRHPINFDHMVEVIFTDPQVAKVGLTRPALEERGIDYVSAEYPFDDHGKSILMEAKYGFVRIFAERPSGRIVGAEIVSKDAGELIHSLAVGVSNNITASGMLKTHWYHPTLSEIISYPLEDIVDELQ